MRQTGYGASPGSTDPPAEELRCFPAGLTASGTVQIDQTAQVSVEEGPATAERRDGGTVSVIGVYGGLIDKLPMGSVMNWSLTIKTGQSTV